MGNRKKNSLWSGGSITVEAVFIVPILLGLIFMITFILFLFHDRIVLQGNANRALYCMAEGTMEIDDGTMRRETENALWAAQVKNIKITKKHRRIIGKVEAGMQWDIPIMEFFLNRQQEINWEGEISCVQPDEIIKR